MHDTRSERRPKGLWRAVSVQGGGYSTAIAYTRTTGPICQRLEIHVCQGPAAPQYYTLEQMFALGARAERRAEVYWLHRPMIGWQVESLVHLIPYPALV